MHIDLRWHGRPDLGLIPTRYCIDFFQCHYLKIGVLGSLHANETRYDRLTRFLQSTGASGMPDLPYLRKLLGDAWVDARFLGIMRHICSVYGRERIRKTPGSSTTEELARAIITSETRVQT